MSRTLSGAEVTVPRPARSVLHPGGCYSGGAPVPPLTPRMTSGAPLVGPPPPGPSYASSYDWSTPARSPWRLLFRPVLAGWVVRVLAALLLGSRPSTLERLDAQVAAGDVQDVRVVGQELAPGVRGVAMVDVHWRDRLGGHVATVIEVRPRNHGLQGVALKRARSWSRDPSPSG